MTHLRVLKRGHRQSARKAAAWRDAKDWRDAEQLALLVRCPTCNVAPARRCMTEKRSAHCTRFERAIDEFPALASAYPKEG